MLLLDMAYRLLREFRQAFTRLDTPPFSNRRHPGSDIAQAVRRRRPKPAVKQPSLTLLAVARAPPAERPFPNPKQLASLSLAQPGSARHPQNARKHNQTSSPGCPATTPTGASGPPHRKAHPRQTDRVPPKPDHPSATYTHGAKGLARPGQVGYIALSGCTRSSIG